MPGNVLTQVLHLAKMAEKAGVDGVVASGQEVSMLRGALKPETLIVVPGIVPVWAQKPSDQKRVTTPHQAIIDGASHIVVGRAIYEAPDPVEAVGKIVEEIRQAKP